MDNSGSWFVQRYGPGFYLCRALANPTPGESSYEDYSDEDGERIYFPTREAALHAASGLTESPPPA